MLDEIKLKIWTHRKIHRNKVDLQEQADRHGINLPISSVEVAEEFLKKLNKRPPRRTPLPPEYYQRYRDAKYEYERAKFPNWITDGHFNEPDMPDTSTANGLTSFIIDHATWMGCHANRINVQGRVINGKHIPSSTKKGTADVALIMQGRSIHLEIKAGKDTPSDKQLKQQEDIRRAGGVYEFVHDVAEYFLIFDTYYTAQ